MHKIDINRLSEIRNISISAHAASYSSSEKLNDLKRNRYAAGQARDDAMRSLRQGWGETPLEVLEQNPHAIALVDAFKAAKAKFEDLEWKVAEAEPHVEEQMERSQAAGLLKSSCEEWAKEAGFKVSE
ncbi:MULTISPECIES: hypothetical protein [unclassified Mesorhizobium]|uniref:hypothetical protein n=1 Tax=unclassified Mesorhizobium TaxID=325217 RepID=UPI001092FEBE|nr:MULTISPECIES: hypothetical protein [unclassified Mesorhizobium]TGQ01416.1 hypothetical protein EN861_01485 [Mesorhizobium sp. M8A.F.Ca.ET.218.01.1.1]TGT20689.1 hypothetical protein EN856_01490 [Mesorhizobium sp. M8A.F.Ca.ET.213.01.1.1]